MPTIVLPLPSLPAGTVLVKAMHAKVSGSTVSESYYNHWFIAAPASAPTFNIVTGIADMASLWFRPFYSGQLPTNMLNVSASMFANIAGHTQSYIDGIGTILPLAGPCLSPMLKVRFRRAYDSPTAPIVGRCSFLPVIRAYLTGNKVNATGKGFYDACLTQYMQTWTSQGVTFTPAIYSQKLNIVQALNSVNVLHQPGMDRKSRWKDAAHSFVYRWPLVL